MHRLWLRDSSFQMWRQCVGDTRETLTGLQDRRRQGLHPRATLIPGAHPARGDPEMGGCILTGREPNGLRLQA